MNGAADVNICFLYVLPFLEIGFKMDLTPHFFNEPNNKNKRYRKSAQKYGIESKHQQWSSIKSAYTHQIISWMDAIKRLTFLLFIYVLLNKAQTEEHLVFIHGCCGIDWTFSKWKIGRYEGMRAHTYTNTNSVKET